MQETVTLADHRSPLQVEYARAAMEQIRQRAHEGLMAAPRVGLGVGGLLLGVRNGARVRVLDSIDVPCSHSAGPAFELAPDEKRECLEMIAEASSPDISRKVGVIGWYCSKTRGDVSLSPADQKLFDELLPGPWQVALVVRPNVVDAMRSAFFFREQEGAVTKGLECYVDEWRPAPQAESEARLEIQPEAERDAEVPPPDTAKVVRITQVPATQEPAVQLNEAPPIEVPPIEVPPTEVPPTEVSPIPELKRKTKAAKTPVKPVALEPPVANRRLVLKIVVPVLLVLLVALAFVTRQFWMPKPALELHFTELDGTLLIRWNPDALRGVDHASMFVNDGGQLTPVLIPLDRFQLTSGLLSYRPQSTRITAKLDAGDTSAIGSWFAPPPAAPATPPATTATGDATPSATEPSPAQSPPAQSLPSADDKTGR